MAESLTRPEAIVPKAAAVAAPALSVPFDLIELLFFAYRDFVGDPDRILADYGFGRAHHACCISWSAGRG